MTTQKQITGTCEQVGCLLGIWNDDPKTTLQMPVRATDLTGSHCRYKRLTTCPHFHVVQVDEIEETKNNKVRVL